MNVTPFRFDFFSHARPNPFVGSGARQSKAIARQPIVTSIISGQFPAQWWHYYARWWFFFGMFFCVVVVVVVVEWKKDGFFFCMPWYRAGGRFCFSPTRIFLFVIYFRRNLYLRFSFSLHSKLFIISVSTSPFSIVANTLRHNWYDRGFFGLGNFIWTYNSSLMANKKIIHQKTRHTVFNAEKQTESVSTAPRITLGKREWARWGSV